MKENKELREIWLKMPANTQISNIGSEVYRAIMWKNRGNKDRQIGFCKKAIELLELSIEDPKNYRRKEEFHYWIEELTDYFIGDNTLGTTDEDLREKYDAFI